MDTMDKPELVRLATPDDISNLYFHLLIDLESDNSLRIPVSEQAVLETVRACCTGQLAIAGVMESRTDGIVASIGIRAVEPWFSKQTVLSQIWLFVSPHARAGRRYYDELFRFAEWHRQDMSARLGYDLVLENTVLSLKRLPAKTRLWRRYGEQIGAVFWQRGAVGELRQDEKDHRHVHDDSGESGGHVRLQRPHPTSTGGRE